jgi:cytochrome c
VIRYQAARPFLKQEQESLLARHFRKQLIFALFAGLFCIASPTNRAGASDIELGEYLSSQCTTCHQLSGKTKGIPSIVGWDAESFIAVLRSYKLKERENQAMQNIAGTLSDDDMAALAAYFATIKPTSQ